MSDRACTASMELCRAIDGGESDPAGIGRLWRAAFDAVLDDMGFKRKAKDAMWGQLVAGNWERLHLTDVEECLDAAAWLEKLRRDVRYFSDRWSIDRLCRAHWAWRQFDRAAGKEDGDD